MDFSQAQKKLAALLEERYGSREGAIIADWTMEQLTGLRKLDRLVRKNEALSLEGLGLYERYSAELAAGRPVQYVLGESWFGGLKFYVDERVLIPRPETEELVDWVLSEASAMGDSRFESADGRPVLLDVGTGSGCIAITISVRLPIVVFACDVSSGALEVAQRNSTALGGKVGFCEVDFLNEESWDMLPVVRWLVSNPPYIPASERKTMAAHVVDAEPALALFVPDEDALVFYRALGRFAKRRLETGGALYAEIHEDLGAAVKEVLLQEGAKKVLIRKDLQGKDRMIKATY